MDQERIDEALELLWVLGEENKKDLKTFKLSSEDEDIDTVIEKMIYDGQVKIEGDDLILTDQGKRNSKGLIRRHRLAERLFTDVFDLRGATIHEEACKIKSKIKNFYKQFSLNSHVINLAIDIYKKITGIINVNDKIKMITK